MDSDRRELEFLRTLGSGGFGAVYLANLHGRDRFVRRVAVKVMREGLDATPDLIARQKDEARLLGLLAHDGIVQVIDLAEVEGRPAVVMEYVEGIDLAELIKSLSPRRVPVRVALETIAGVAAALDAAYNSDSALTGQPLRVIHRDIKPANMLLTVHGRVKVLDFGVAKADFARDGHTTNGSWGTPRFMSPEQWLGETYGAPIDIYALGVTLFDLVADRPWERPPLARTPFESRVGDMLNAQSDVPDTVLEIIEAMTRFEAADRPTAAEVQELTETAAGLVGGETLARFARVEVPPMVEARSRSNAHLPLPGTVTLSGASMTGDGRVEPPPEPSMVTNTSPVPAPPARFRPALAGLVLATLLVGLATVVGLGALAWSTFGGFSHPAVAIDEVPFAEKEPVAVAVVEPVAPEGLPPEPPVVAAEPVVAPFVVDEVEEPVAVAIPRENPPSRAAEDRAIAAPKQTDAAKSTAVEAPVPVAMYPLEISTNPLGKEVWINGKSLGRQPITGRQFPAGKYRVEIGLDGGGRTEAKIVTLPGSPPSIRYYVEESVWRTVHK